MLRNINIVTNITLLSGFNKVLQKIDNFIEKPYLLGAYINNLKIEDI